MEADRLVELGLTRRESYAYLALLKLEEAKAGEIAQYIREDRTNVYDSLRSLIKKGLVSSFVKGKKNYYRVASPQKLGDYLKEKEKILKEILPYLEMDYRSYKLKPVVEVYEGVEGVKTILLDILREKSDFVCFGATDRASVLLPDFTRRYLKDRERLRIRARQIYPKGEKVLLSKFSQFKAIPREYLGPATTLIYRNKVVIFMWFTEPTIAVLIKSEEAAKAYRNQFEFMWRMI